MKEDLISKNTRNEFREFLVGWTLRVKHGDQVSTSASMKPSSLTKVHEHLEKPYWPQRICPHKEGPRNASDAADCRAN